MSRIFLSHSSRDAAQAVALKRWLVEQDPGLAEEIFLDLDRDTGIAPGERWKEALLRANQRCEAVICLLSAHWQASPECHVEYRTAENLGKLILCARLEPLGGEGITGEWQRCDLFGPGPTTEIEVELNGQSRAVSFLTEGLQRLHRGLRRAGIGAEHFPWPPPQDPDRAPYRGWEPLEEIDAAVFFGRDTQILAALDELRAMLTTGAESLFVVLGPSGAGKSSFLRAGLLPRLRRDDRRFLVADIVRPERNVLTGDRGFAAAVHALLAGLGPAGFGPTAPTLGQVKAACITGDAARLRGWLTQARQAARARLIEADEAPAPTVVLPLDQAEELFSADAGPEAPKFLALLAKLTQVEGTTPALIVAGTIRADFYEMFQTAPQLAGLSSVVFDRLKPMPVARFAEVILGPAARTTAAGRPVTIEPALVDRLLEDSGQGADTLPLLALTLKRLYEDYGSDGALTVVEYEDLGGMLHVVQHEIDALLSRDPAVRQRQLELLRAAFVPWLASINPDTDQPVRRIARLADLPAASRPLIEAMVQRRLLVRGRRGGEAVVEVGLESLLRQWPELAGWLDTERNDLKEADGLERAATAWESNDRNEAWLLEGQRLVGAEALIAKPGFRGRLHPVRAFLLASRQREDDRAEAEQRRQDAELRAAQHHAQVLRKRSRVLMMVLTATVVVAVLAVAGFVQASLARSDADARAREATSLRLVSEGQAMLEGDRQGGDVRALQQLLTAHALAPTAEGQTAVSRAAISQRDVQKILATGSPTLAVAFSPDGRRIVSGSEDGAVRWWDAATGQAAGEPTMIGDEGTVLSVAFSPDGRRIVSSGDDGTVRVWDAATGQAAGEAMTGHTNSVSSVAFSPDGRRIVSGGFDGTVRWWDAATSLTAGEPLTGHQGWVTSVAFSPDSRRVVSGGADGTVRWWDAATGRAAGEAMTGHANSVSSVVFSPDGRRIVSGGRDGTVRVWDAATGQAVGEPLTGHEGWVRSVAFSPDGRRIASVGQDGTVRLWDAVTGTPLIGHNDEVWSVAFNPDGQKVVSGGDDGKVRVWDAATGQAAGEVMTGPGNPVSSVAFSPDGRRIVSGGSDGTVRLWDAGTGQPIGEPMTGHGEAVFSVAFSLDGLQILSCGGDGRLRLWDAATGQAVGEPLTGHEGWARSVAFSPDGRRIASVGQDGRLRLWDAVTGTPLIGYIDEVWSVAFSLDGQKVVSGGDDGKVRVWDAGTGQPIGEPMTGPEDTVWSVAFSPDGRRIVSGGSDGTVRVWDPATGQAAGEMTGHQDPVLSVAFSPDSRLIVSGSADGTVRLWPSPASWADALCSKLTHNMSHQQWDDWVSPAIEYIEACPGLPTPDETAAR